MFLGHRSKRVRSVRVAYGRSSNIVCYMCAKLVLLYLKFVCTSYVFLAFASPL